MGPASEAGGLIDYSARRGVNWTWGIVIFNFGFAKGFWRKVAPEFLNDKPASV